eukprot:TRINITY_DN3677_c0_g1_i1.p1 TRINITY_DN3677_c0_g1~~TRINITY_DN3677_c0_g1_i1.p1  ORF type:complete len:1238 (-),score=321.43 TRINITY_DN3677_c0_g1_i1:229-3942(-)
MSFGGADGKFTLADVESHNTPQSLWLIIDGKVYDVTNFQDDHPGGSMFLLQHGGGDATAAARNAHKGSIKQLQKMQEFLIGEVVAQEDENFGFGEDSDEIGVDDEDLGIDEVAEEIQTDAFEELRLSKENIAEVREAWRSFLNNYDTIEMAGEAMYSAIFESAPTLQNLFTTPKAIQAMRFIYEIGTYIDHLEKPRALKALVESLAFRHLNLDVTVPRAMIFRDSIIDLLDSDLGDNFSKEARTSLMALLGWIGGANIFVRTNYAGRLKTLTTSWRKANKLDEDPMARAAAARAAAEEAAKAEAEDDENKKEGEKTDADAANEAIGIEIMDGVEEQQGDHVQTKKTSKGFCCGLFGKTSAAQDSSGTSASRDGGQQEVAVAESTANKTMDRNQELFVPTTFQEMFEFNSAVMGFGSTGSWLQEVLNVFDAIVQNAADANRLQEECDVLILRISRTTKGPINLNQFKSCMLASLRSLLPKEWDTNYEVAWNWLWENVERLITKNLDMPPKWEAALRSMMDGHGPETLHEMRSTIYDKFFVAAPLGQEYFKQSDTRLHFIADKVFQFTMELFQEPWQMVDDISALGLRHVGYGVPTELFGPFVTVVCEVINDFGTDKLAVQAFRWSIGLISKMLVRTINEGSTIVMKAVNANSGKQLRKALSVAPRGARAQWCLKVQVGTHSISPLFWSIQSGSLDAAKAVIEDLLVIRADRERYYYGADALFLRHQDIMSCLCREAPGLLKTILAGLVWRSTRSKGGLRRANYYVKHLIINEEGKPADALRELCLIKDPKIMVDSVVVKVSDTLWSGVVQKQFFREKLWFIISLGVFMLCQGLLPKIPAIKDELAVRWIIFLCRIQIYINTMLRLIYFHTKTSFLNFSRGKWKRRWGIVPWPKYLRDTWNLGNLVMTVLLVLMCSHEPFFHCGLQDTKNFPIGTCEDMETTVRRYSAFGMGAMFLHWALMIDLAVFSTGLSAFVLVVAQVLSEIGRFLIALIFLLLAFGSAISVLDHDYFEMRDIPNTIVALFAITVLLFEDDYRSMQFEPALLTAVLMFVLASSILLMNLLIAQLNNSYVFIYQDMVGFARLNRAQRIVETLSTFRHDKWTLFIESLGFQDALEFNEGDVGVNGGIQVLEPASAHVVPFDSVVRYGGSCAEDMQWPEDNRQEKDAFSKVEKMAKKVLRHVTKASKGGGLGASGLSGDGGTGSKGQSGMSGLGSGMSQGSQGSQGAGDSMGADVSGVF